MSYPLPAAHPTRNRDETIKLRIHCSPCGRSWVKFIFDGEPPSECVFCGEPSPAYTRDLS